MTMDKLVFKKIDPAAPRITIWPCIVKRAQDGGKVVEMALDVKLQHISTEARQDAESPMKLIGKNADLAIYDLTVKGFSDLPGAGETPDDELVMVFRDDEEVVKACARGYYEMINGRVAGN